MRDPRLRTLAIHGDWLPCDAQGGGAVVERPRHDLDVLTLFDRCRSTLGAIHHLLLEGFVHEAVLLGRPLFTESLTLAELASVDPTRRAELVVGWHTAGLASFRRILLEARSSGDDVTDQLVRLDERKAEFERYAARLGVRTRAWKPNERALADAHGRSDEYSAFRLTHHFVHGSALAASQRYSKIADRGSRRRGRTPRPLGDRRGALRRVLPTTCLPGRGSHLWLARAAPAPRAVRSG